jgi:hypothetical protein
MLVSGPTIVCRTGIVVCMPTSAENLTHVAAPGVCGVRLHT